MHDALAQRQEREFGSAEVTSGGQTMNPIQSRHTCHSHRSTFWRQDYLMTNSERAVMSGSVQPSKT